MKIEAERISRKLDGQTLCHPSEGYIQDSIEIDLCDYDEILSLAGTLPENDAIWPRGAPFPDLFRYGDKIFRKKTVS